MEFKNFIRGTEEYSTFYKNIPAPVLRKNFELNFIPKESKLKICVSGFYELYINGKKITKGLLAPFINNPDHILYYDEYEISKHLAKGKNAVAVILGNGFANQDSPRQNNNKAPFRAPLAMSLILSAKDENNAFNLESDETFKVHHSPVLYDMYRFGIIYDARMEIEGFSCADFDDSGWESAKITTPPKGKITKSKALPITKQYELKPQNIEKQTDLYYFYDNDGNPFEKSYVKEAWCYDFGYSCAGLCRLKIKGERGQKITLRHSEFHKDGKFNMNSIFTIRKGDEEYFHLFQADTYILKGGEEEVFVPTFTYHGFRYVLIEGITEKQATEDLLTFEVMNSNILRRSHFSCSDSIINTLYEMAIRSDLSNFYHFPTDCPHREKNGWTGDTSVSACQFLLSFDNCAENFKMWLESVRYSQKDSGQIPGVVPTNDWGYAWGSGPVWDSVIVNLPYHVYKFTGRTDIIEENADMIYKYLKYISGKRDEKGLIACGLGDWCQPGRSGDNCDAPLNFTDTSQTYKTAERSAFLFDLIGKNEEKAFALNFKDELRASIREHLIDFETYTVSGDCQTSQAVALRMGLFNDDEYDKAYKKLLEIIKRDNSAITCGMIGLRNIFHVLCDNGDSDLALSMITKKDAPSYRGMLDQGGTALFESFVPNGVQESQNHHFFGDIINLFISKIAGININPYMNDIYEVLINPLFPEKLEYASADYYYGDQKIAVNWKRIGSKIAITADMPQIAHGKIKLKNNVFELKTGKNEFII